VSRLLAGLVPALLLLSQCGHPVFAEEEVHQHEGMTSEVDRFYSTWMRPDQPNASCCNKNDCHPVEVKQQGGTWFMRQSPGDKFTPVPNQKIEQNRDSPDGQNHGCMTKGPYPVVYCLVLGAGG
jgi:hypothetical protein